MVTSLLIDNSLILAKCFRSIYDFEINKSRIRN